MDVNEMIERAEGEVDRALLQGTGSGNLVCTGYFGDGPLIAHLRNQEKVDYALQNFRKGLTVEKDGVKERIKPGSRYRTAMLVTHRRILFVVGCEEGDETVSVPFEKVRKVKVKTGILKDKITVKADSACFDMYVRKGSELEDIANHILDLARSITERRDTTNHSSNESDCAQKSQSPDGLNSTSSASGLQNQAKLKADGSGRNMNRESNNLSKIELLASNEAGDPISNATVTAESDVFQIKSRTSDTGRCNISLPPTVDSVKVEIDHPTYEIVRSELTVEDGTAIDVTLTETESMEMGEEPPHQQTKETPSQRPNGKVGTPTREALVQELIDLQKGREKRITRGLMRADGKFEPEDYEKEFGNWSTALRSVTFPDENSEVSSSEPTNQEAYSKAEVLDAIADVAQRVGGRPSTEDMNEHGRMSVGPAYRIFDSWSEAVEAATRTDSDTTEKSSTSAISADIDESFEEPSPEDPLVTGLENVPRGRLSGVVVDVLTVTDSEKPRRNAEITVRTQAGEDIELIAWEKHNVDWSFDVGDLLRLDEVRLKRWGDDDAPSHHLSTTRDFSVTKLDEASEEHVGSSDTFDSHPDSFSDPIEKLTGIGGATETDATVLMEAGYETPEDLEAATLEELRDIPDLDDGVALRIKAELG
ncbi:homing endonuclease associated repeat-containing protein [Halovivax gelatinilyticus]|uniref:homing endonuclease associated repeat-containing protein n=1 Tax=Halovivax gelatinilyticus TaxID=2961597 RepID=UPI0020CA8980|nr:helix-hairpin-helix domain-containing protein [Halovivax gelatinilyticus]